MTPNALGRCGKQDYARMYCALVRKPRTAAQMSEYFGTSLQRCREQLWAMVTLRIAQVLEWRQQSAHGLQVPVFDAGHGEIAPYPGYLGLRTRAGTSATARRPGAEMIAFADFIGALRDGVSLVQMHVRTGQAKMRLSQAIRMMHGIGGVHIAAWERPRAGRWQPVWEIGGGTDAVRPARKSKAAVQRDCRARRVMRAESPWVLSARSDSIESAHA